LQNFIQWLFEDEEGLENVRFAEVVEAVSSHRVLPVDPSDAVDAQMLGAVQSVVVSILASIETGPHVIHEVGRINETSRYIENALLAGLNAVEGLTCSIPLTASGDSQRSGYPDMRLLHEKSGRVFYLDPKVYKAGSETSSFRTFYFEPKQKTNKILDDASHLILGISHKGKVDGRWHFNNWKLVDLADFRVRLKAEFQASNRDLYRTEAILLDSN
jgi:hypothetical protein